MFGVLKFIFVLSFGLFSNSHAFAGSKDGAFAKPVQAKQKAARVHVPKRIDNVVGRAHQLLGTPYRWGGTSVSKGFDCSGLLVYLFRSEAGVQLPRTTASMMQSRALTISRHNLKSGDAVFFKHNGGARTKHVGLYIGGNRFIHAPRTGAVIRIDSLSNKYWGTSFVTAKRFY